MLRRKNRLFLFVALLIALPVSGLDRTCHAAEHARPASGKPSDAIKGTWVSPRETLTFNANGTIVYKGKRYYYAVSNGGAIQLTGRSGSSLTIPYTLVSGRLTLTVDGKATTYTRKR